MITISVEILDPTGERRLAFPSGTVTLDVDIAAMGKPWLIVNATRDQLGLDTAYLRSEGEGLVVLECLHPADALTAGAYWLERPERAFVPAWQEWQRPGWLTRVTRIVDRVLRAAGLARRGAPLQIRHTSISAVLRVPADRGAVWFKQVPPLFAAEGRVCEWVAAALPGAVPRVIACSEGWMITADIDSSVAPARGSPLGTLADVQIRSIARDAELLALGCPDHRPDKMLAALSALSARADLLEPIEFDALQQTLSRFKTLWAQLAELPISCTLVHGDLHAANVCWTKTGWVLFDWTDSALAHPFLDLTMGLKGLKPQARARATEEFVRRWRPMISDADAARALGLVPALGALYQVESHRRMADSIGLDLWRKDVSAWLQRAMAAL